MPDFDECCDPAELLDLSGRKGLVVGIANDRSLAWPAALGRTAGGPDPATLQRECATRTRRCFRRHHQALGKAGLHLACRGQRAAR